MLTPNWLRKISITFFAEIGSNLAKKIKAPAKTFEVYLKKSWSFIKNRRVVHQGTTSDNKWYNEWERVTTSENEWQRVTTNNNEWYNKLQRVATSSATSDNEWQRMKKIGNEWQRVIQNNKEWQQITTIGTTNYIEWQRVVQRVTTSGTMSDNKWQRMKKIGNELQRVIKNNNEWQNEWQRVVQQMKADESDFRFQNEKLMQCKTTMYSATSFWKYNVKAILH